MRHGQTAQHDLVAIDVHEYAAIGFVRAPAGLRIRLAKRGDVLWLSTNHRESVQMTAIFGR
jgi:hypothetical protein